jgi:hypothetical protein
VRSVPTELNKDHSGILGLAQVCFYLCYIQLAAMLLYTIMLGLSLCWKS